MKIQKLVFTHPSYDWKDSNGNPHKTSFYKIVLDSGYGITFQPTKKDDYTVLNAICEVVFIDKPKEVNNEVQSSKK